MRARLCGGGRCTHAVRTCWFRYKTTAATRSASALTPGPAAQRIRNRRRRRRLPLPLPLYVRFTRNRCFVVLLFREKPQRMVGDYFCTHGKRANITLRPIPANLDFSDFRQQRFSKIAPGILPLAHAPTQHTYGHWRIEDGSLWQLQITSVVTKSVW